MNDTTTPAADMLAATARNAVDGAAGLAETAENVVRGAAARTAQQARELQDKVVGIATEDLRKVRSYVQENPLVATCIALAAGVLISKLIRR